MESINSWLKSENMDNKNPSGEGMFRHCQGETSLHSAAKNGHVELCQIIMDNLADKNPPGRLNALTPLHLAARYGHFGVCELILNQVDLKNPKAKYFVVVDILVSSILKVDLVLWYFAVFAVSLLSLLTSQI